jgi:hypothetical protein
MDGIGMHVTPVLRKGVMLRLYALTSKGRHWIDKFGDLWNVGDIYDADGKLNLKLGSPNSRSMIWIDANNDKDFQFSLVPQIISEGEKQFQQIQRWIRA